MDSLDDNFATVWRWYWKDNSGWIAYADVCIHANNSLCGPAQLYMGVATSFNAGPHLHIFPSSTYETVLLSDLIKYMYNGEHNYDGTMILMCKYN